MKQKNGIICLETEWEHTIERNRRSIHTKPLLEFLEKSSECEIIYRRVATKNELQYYLRRFNLTRYDNYSIIYLSFHGDTHSIFLEGEKGDEAVLSLSDLAHLSDGVFKDRFVHFSSCRTLLGSEKELETFKTETGAKCISGYTKSVDGILSAINDIAYFDRIFNYATMKGLESAMDKPKSVIRISQCCMAMRSPLISPRWTGKTALFLKTLPDRGYACPLFCPNKPVLRLTRIG